MSKDLTGMVFTRLKVVGAAPSSKSGRRRWWCECQCEEHKRLIVDESKLLSGNTRSCGCLQRESVINRNKTHGFRHHPLYGTHKMFKHRGLPIYEEWTGGDGVKNFINWAETAGGYKEGTRLYRKDLTKGFFPDNLEFKEIKHPHPESVPRKRNETELIGQTFGKLKVIDFAGSQPRKDGERVRYWLCECSCPDHNRVVVSTDKLRSGKKQDCGCVAARKVVAKEYDLDNTEGILNSCDEYLNLPNDIRYIVYKRLWEIHRKMMERCYNPDNQAYDRYGGRGIDVCNEWADQATGLGNFIVWSLKNGYATNLTIDRIDNDKGYNPKNCQWATYKEQGNNKRNNVLIYDGLRWFTMRQFEEHYRKTEGYVATHLSRKWSIDAIVHDAICSDRDIRRVDDNYWSEGCLELIPIIPENAWDQEKKLKAYNKQKNGKSKKITKPKTYQEYLLYLKERGDF